MKIQTLAQQLLFNTVPIETKDKNGNMLGTGTSFVIAHSFEGHGEELFLVTNKHVIQDAWLGYVYFTHIKGDQPDIGNPFFVEMEGFENQWHGHPAGDIDVAVLPISWQLDLIGKDASKAYYMKISTEIIASKAEIDAMDALRRIIFVGYPNGLFDRKNYTPIIRHGFTATPIQLDFNGRPVFLVDASVFPGSSGSPVFSFEESWTGNIINLKLLGILAAVFTQTDVGTFELVPAPTQVMPIVKTEQMIDLGVVFKAHLIKETIEDFWAKHVHIRPPNSPS